MTEDATPGSAAQAASADELSLVLADDQIATRMGIRRAVEPHRMRIVAEAADSASALRACLEHRPDVLVLAIGLPGNGIDAARMIKTALPELKIVMVAPAARSEELFGALRAGADGYLLMSTSPERLPHAIRGVARGEAALPRLLTADLIREFRERGQGRSISVPGTDAEITAREFEVLELLRRGRRTAQVAARLGISEVTVRRHVSAILRKLGAPDRKTLLEMLDGHPPAGAQLTAPALTGATDSRRWSTVSPRSTRTQPE